MNVTINILELASELASYELEEKYSEDINLVYIDLDNGDTCYTKEAQEIFNDLYDKFYAVIESYSIKP